MVTLIRYLLLHHAMRVGIALALLTLVYLVFDLGGPGRLLAADLGWAPVLGAAALHIPLTVVQLLPAAMLLGGAVSVSALTRRGELEAMRAAGMQPARMAIPWLTMALGTLIFSGAANELVVPPCEQRADLLYRYRRASALTGAFAGRSWHSSPDARWFVRMGTQTAGVRPIWALQLDDAHRLQHSTMGRLVAGTDLVRYARRVSFGDQGVTITHLPRLRMAALGPIARASETGRTRPEALSSAALRRRISRAQNLGHGSSNDRMVLHARLAYPWLNLIVALLAWAPMRSHRRPTPTGPLGRAAGWIVVLWLLLASGWLMGTTGLLPPRAAAWTPLALATLLVTLSVRLSPARA